MFHVTTAAAVEPILGAGIRPGSDFGFSSKQGFFRTRENHVYLGDMLSLPVVEVCGERAYLHVDLRRLDPSLLDPDEDQVQASFDRPGQGWVGTPPPTRSKCDADGDDEYALARWADTIDGFDCTHVTAKSLESGRVSFRGTIPVDAISTVVVPSEASELFRVGAAKALASRELSTLVSPQLGFYKTEIRRCMTLAGTLISSVVSEIGESPGSLALDWRNPEDACTSRDLLVDLKRIRARSGDEAATIVLGVAKRLAHAVQQLYPELGWSSSREACTGIAEAGVEVVACARDQLGIEVARAIALGGVDAVAAIMDP